MLDSFRLAHYRLTLKALEPLYLPPFKGSALRGGFGHTFKRLVCFEPQPCGKKCELGNGCPYGYIFETRPPAGSEVLRTFNEVSRPFVIEPPNDRRTYIPAGEALGFGLTLVGQGINYLAYFIAVFRELGRVGLGRERGEFCLLAMEAVGSLSAKPSALAGGGNLEPVYRAEDEMIRTVEATIRGETIAAHAATLPTNRITLNFLTPTRLKHRGQWVWEGPPFQVLIRSLLGRISSLSYFHCGQRFETDFRGLIDRAAGVRIVESETRWQDWPRFSGRQKQRIELGGLMGRVTYEGDLGDYRPLLALGEFVHVGKGTVFGNGRYKITGQS